MNIALFEEIKKIITEEPKRLDMGDWVVTKTTNWNCAPLPECGTVGCIAGWAAILTSEGEGIAEKGNNARRSNISHMAREALGITYNEGELLFYAADWPLVFRDRYFATEDKIERAQITCDRIDYFIEHGQ